MANAPAATFNLFKFVFFIISKGMFWSRKYEKIMRN